MAGDRPKKNRGFAKMLLIIVLLSASVLAVTLAVRSQREGGIRALWRSLTGEKYTDEFFFENASGGDVHDLQNGLAVAATSGLYVYDSAGELLFNKLYTYQEPALSVAGKYAACTNIGGNGVIFFTRDGVIKEITADFPVISATVSEEGYLTVCTEDSGYYGSVTVYNSLGTAIFRWQAGNSRTLMARVHGHEYVVILTVGEGGTRLLKFRLDSEETQAEYVCRDLMISFSFTTRGITAVTTVGLIGLTEDLTESWTYDLEGRYLEGLAYDGDLTVLALSNYQVGGGRSLITVTADGVERASVEIPGSCRSVDARDNAVALLSDGEVTLYDPDLRERGRFQVDTGAERVELREDGSFVCAGTFSAYVYNDPLKS